MTDREAQVMHLLHPPDGSESAPAVMGIINCTPDSFFSGSRRTTSEDAVRTALEMEAAGADILDIGGESTRPGSRYIEAEEELQRVVPVIEQIRQRSSIPISVDTRKGSVARAAAEAGADMINDVSALEEDEDLVRFLAESGMPVVLMHKKGIPENMQNKPWYDDVVTEVAAYLRQRVEFALSRGIGEDKIVLDPGIGFGKRLKDNLLILRNLEEFTRSGFPLLLGVSRKSFIGTVTRGSSEAGPPSERLNGTLAVHAWACSLGVRILRVHDVAENRDVVTMIDAILHAGEE